MLSIQEVNEKKRFLFVFFLLKIINLLFIYLFLFVKLTFLRNESIFFSVVITNLQKRGGLDDEKYEGLIQRSIEVTHPLYSALQVQ